MPLLHVQTTFTPSPRRGLCRTRKHLKGAIPISRAHAKNSVFAVDDSGGTLRTITAHIDNVSGLPGAGQLSEVTAFGDLGEKFIRGIEGTTFTVSGVFDNTASTGSITVLNGLRTTETTSSFEYGPEGSTSTKIKYSGECWLESLTVDSSVKDAVKFSATFRLDSVVTVGTYS